MPHDSILPKSLQPPPPPHPRDLFLREGRDGVRTFLHLRGSYVPQKKPLTYFCNLLWYHTPLLLEGERGAGKTQLPESVAEAFNLELFSVNCNSETNRDEMLGDWNKSLQQFYSAELRQSGCDIEAIGEQIFTKKFFNFGMVLKAFDYSASTGKPCVLLIDEVDKLKETAEDFLLQILARGYANVPLMRPDDLVGFTKSFSQAKIHRAFPLVMLTSNNMRGGINSLIRSRCSVCNFKSPTQEEMCEIVLSRVPELGQAQYQPIFVQLVRFIDAVRGLPLGEKPALREYIRFAERITRAPAPINKFSLGFIEDNLDALAKTEKDEKLFEERIESLLQSTLEPNKLLMNGTRNADGYFTAEQLVNAFLQKRYDLETNLSKFIVVN